MKTQINEINLTTAKQINAKELKFAKFNLMFDNDKNAITVQKGKKFVVITYNKGSDLYDVELGKIKGFDYTTEKVPGVYADMLQDLIQNHFPNFEYVMEGLMMRRC